jgi:hypothetical protein
MPRKPYKESGPLVELVPDTLQRARARRKALDDGFAALPPQEQDIIKRQAERLINGPPETRQQPDAPKPIKGLGLDSAQEVLAALGSLMNREAAKRDGKK